VSEVFFSQEYYVTRYGRPWSEIEGHAGLIRWAISIIIMIVITQREERKSGRHSPFTGLSPAKELRRKEGLAEGFT
jgi:hypothetical protein